MIKSKNSTHTTKTSIQQTSHTQTNHITIKATQTQILSIICWANHNFYDKAILTTVWGNWGSLKLEKKMGQLTEQVFKHQFWSLQLPHYTLLHDRRGLKNNERQNLYHSYFQLKLPKSGMCNLRDKWLPYTGGVQQRCFKGVLKLVEANIRYSSVSITQPRNTNLTFSRLDPGWKSGLNHQSQSTSPLLEFYPASTHVSLTASGNGGIGSGLGRGSCGLGGPSAYPSGRHSPRPCPFWELGAFWLGLFPPTAFPSRELKIVPLGWGLEASSEGGICANMGLGEELLPPREWGMGWAARQESQDLQWRDAPSWPQPPPSCSRERLRVSSCLPDLTGSTWANLYTESPGLPGSAKAPGWAHREQGLLHSSAGSILVPLSQCPSYPGTS